MRELTLDRALIEVERQAALDEDSALVFDDVWSIDAPTPVFDRLAKQASRRGPTLIERHTHGLS